MPFLTQGATAPHACPENPLAPGSSGAESWSRTAAFWPSGLGPQQAGCSAAGTAHLGPSQASRADPRCWGSCGYARQQGRVKVCLTQSTSLVRAVDEQTKGLRGQMDCCTHRDTSVTTSVYSRRSKGNRLVLYLSSAKSKEQYHNSVAPPPCLCGMNSECKIEGICLSVP